MAKYKLKELCEFITDGTHQTPEYCGNDGVIFLSSKDVTERKINWDSVKYIPNALHEKLCKRLKPRKNDILLAKNGTTGVAAIVDRDEIFDVYVSLAVLRPLKIVSVYDVSINSNLKVKEFKEMTEEWLDFIIACRSGKIHDYDIVIGAMADDQIYNYISDYMDGVITREQFWILAKFKYPTHQIVFCTDDALKCLHYRGYEEVV